MHCRLNADGAVVVRILGQCILVDRFVFVSFPLGGILTARKPLRGRSAARQLFVSRANEKFRVLAVEADIISSFDIFQPLFKLVWGDSLIAQSVHKREIAIVVKNQILVPKRRSAAVQRARNQSWHQ